MLETAVAIAVLLVLSAFFSGCETALTVASRPVMHELERKGNRRAAMVLALQREEGRLIGAILLGNNVVNISASALSTALLIGLFGEAGVVYATVGMTVLILVFSEILPKTYAFRFADRAALAMAPVIRPVVVVLAPITHGIQVFIQALFRLFGVDFAGKRDTLVSSSQMLRGAIEMHGRSEEEKRERVMLRSVLDLAEIQVGEIMVHRKNLVRINADQPPAEILREALESPYTRIPLWRGEPDNIVGVLHVKEVLRALIARGGATEGLDVVALAAEPWFVPDTTLLPDQLHEFRARRAHIALVVDEYGSLMGVVTLEDILEEIVGDISDEHDVHVSGVRALHDGTYVVRGDVTIREINRDLDWTLPDEAAATVAGLVLHEARRIPEVGQAFRFHGFRFEVLRRQRNQIASLRITPPERRGAAKPPPETGDRRAV